jgi:hypothetical protein
MTAASSIRQANEGWYDFYLELHQFRFHAALPEIGYHDNMEGAIRVETSLTGLARSPVLSLTEYFQIPFI